MKCTRTTTNNYDSFSNRVTPSARKFWLSVLIVLEGVIGVGGNMNLSISSVSFEGMKCTLSRSVLWRRGDEGSAS